MYAEMQSKAHEIISAVVTNIEPVKGIVTLELGKGGVATLPRNEQVAGEELREGQHVKVYVVDVMETCLLYTSSGFWGIITPTPPLPRPRALHALMRWRAWAREH